MIEEDNDANTVLGEEEEDEAPQIFAASGDPDLPHILKIGQQGYAEYIDLGSMPTRKEGVDSNQFNQFQIGNRLIELQRMYNVVGKENIIAMQRAFGVRSLHQDPPIVKNIQDGCLPLDFKLVQKALQYRIGTLKTRLGLKDGQFSSKSDERRLKWIETILEQTKGITKSCTGSTKEIHTEVQTETRPPQSAECACLSDMNLLRDLVYIMSLIQGVTNPEVKKQLEKLTLKRLLASARNSAAEPPKNILQDIIEFLEKNIDVLDKNSTKNTNVETQELLRAIYNSLLVILGEEKVGDDTKISSDMILEALRNIRERMRELQAGLREADDENEGLNMLLNEYVADLEGAQREIDGTRAALDGSNEEIGRLRGIIDEYNTEINRLAEFIRRLQEQLAQQTIGYRAAIDELMRFNEEQRARLEGVNERLRGEKNAIIAGLTLENEVLRNRLGELTAEIDRLNRILEERDAEIEELATQVDDEKGSTQAATEMVEEFERRLRACEEDREGLRARLAAAETERNAAVAARNTATRERNAATAAAEAATERATSAAAERNAATAAAQTASSEKAAIQRDLDELRNRLQTLQGDVDTRQARIATLEAQVAELRGQLETLGREKEEQRRKCEEDIATKTREIAELNRTKAAAIAEKDVRIAALQQQLEALTKQLAEKDALLAEKNRQIAADEAEKEQLRTAAAAAEATGTEAAAALRTENEALTAELAKLREDLTTESGKLAALTATHDEFKKRLGNLLNLLLVDPRLRETAQRFMEGEGDADSPPAELKAPSAEMCTFFQYLTTVVNLQMRKLTSSALSPEIKRDILTMYTEVTAVDKGVLLKELTDFFQQVFAHISQARTIEEGGFILRGDFPEMVRIFGKSVKAELRSGSPKSQIFLNELGSFGILSKVIVEPTGVNKMILKKVQGVGIPTGFVGENTAGETPLVVMGIKYMQLLAEVLNTKYSEIARQCGSSGVAIESEPEEAPPARPVSPPPAPAPVADYKQRVIDAIRRGRGDFNTASAIGTALSNYTRLVNQKGNPQDKQNYNRYYLEILLGLYKNFYDNQRGKTPIVKLDIPAVIGALFALGEKQQDLSKSEKLESIMTRLQSALPSGL